MTTLREAAEIALEALEYYRSGEDYQPTPASDAITALREALAQPQPEPVAWMVYTLDGKSAFVTDNPKDFTQDHRALPLYTHPPQRKPLTDEDIEKLMTDTWGFAPQSVPEFARLIERAHGIGSEE